MYILKRVLETKSRQMLWIQYLIVALRTLAIAAFVLAFIRPHAAWRPPSQGAFPPARPSTHRLVLVDTSASMQARFENGKSIDAVMSLCRKILLAGRYPGRVELVPLNGRNQSWTAESFPVDTARQEQLLAECAAATGAVDLEKGLRSALASFRASPFDQRELYILSDFAVRDFTGNPSLGPLLQTLRQAGVRIYGLRYHPANASNFALVELTPMGDVLLARQPAWFYLTLGYYGDPDTSETTVTVTTGKGDPILEQTLALVNGEKVLKLPLELPAGEVTVTAQLHDDDLGLDNVLRRTFMVKDRMAVMVVQNIVMKSGFDNPRTWLNLVLANPAKGADSSGPSYRDIKSGAEAMAAADKAAREKAEGGAVTDKPFEIELNGKIPEQLNAEQLAAADFVILMDVAEIGAENGDALRAYVQRGGTVLLAPGPDADPARFNRSFGLLSPAVLDAPRVKAINPEQYEQCYVEAGEDPLLRELEAADGANLGSPRFYNNYRIQPDSLAEGARVLLSLTDSSPLLLDRTVGRGRVLLWTAGLGGEWHSMVVHPGYPVMLVRLMNQAMAQKAFPRNLRPGQPIVCPVSATRAKIVRPDGNSEVVDSVKAGSTEFIRYDRTDVPGDYDVRTDVEGDTPGEPYHVSNDYRESDVRTLRGEAQKTFERACGTTICETEPALVKALGASYAGRPLAAWMAILAIVCLLAEAGLSRRFFT